MSQNGLYQSPLQHQIGHDDGSWEEMQHLQLVWTNFMNFPPFRLMIIMIFKLYVALCIPLYNFYLRVPSIGWFGGWGGRNMEDICHQLSNYMHSEMYWIANAENYKVCERRVWNHFMSNMSFIDAFLYLAFVYFFFRYFISTLKKGAWIAGDTFRNRNVFTTNRATNRTTINRSPRSSPQRESPKRSPPKRSPIKLSPIKSSPINSTPIKKSPNKKISNSDTLNNDVGKPSYRVSFQRSKSLNNMDQM